MVGHLGDGVAGNRSEHRVGVLVVRKRGERNREGEASPSRPSRVVDLKSVAKDASGPRRHQALGDAHVARRIAQTNGPEIDDRAQTTLAGEQVARE